MISAMTFPRLRYASAGLVLALLGCSGPPNFDDRVSPEARQADFPTLVAIDPVLAAHGGPVSAAPAAAGLAAQAEALQRRADRLSRGGVIDPATLRRLEAARAAAEAQ